MERGTGAATRGGHHGGPSAAETGQSEIRDRIAEIIHGIQAKNLDALRRIYAPDVISFDVEPPLQHVGVDAFEGTGMCTTLRLLEGRLPRYDKLFTLDNPAVAVTERGALADAVRRVAVVAEPNSPIRLDFSAQGTVLLQAGYEDDIASQQLAATLADAEDVAVAFNPAYLLEALNSFNGSQVRFELLGPGWRALLTGVPDEGDAAREDHRRLLIIGTATGLTNTESDPLELIT
ncbi:hypothetical protein [Streptomyces puniciscabiei]|uniref:hypothetical protein n=1 Tax=Streptomyces puniciscabiei TaxID=164348 RepID=UPI00379AF5DD